MLLVALLASTGALAEPEKTSPAQPDARAIIAAAAKRQGGARLAKPGAISDFEIKLDVREVKPEGDGGPQGAGDLIRRYKPPTATRKKPLFRERWSNSTATTERGLGYSGRFWKGWTKRGKRVTPLGPTHAATIKKLRKDADDMDLLLRTFLLCRLLDEGATLTLLGTVKLEDRSEHRIKVEAKGRAPSVLGIDSATFDVTRIILPAPAPEANEHVFLFPKHKAFPIGPGEKVRVPYDIRVHVRSPSDRKASKPGPRTTRAFLDGLKFNQGLPDSAFDVPKSK